MREVSPTPQAEPSSWTLSLRRYFQRTLPLTHLLPDRQPVFVVALIAPFPSHSEAVESEDSNDE